MSLTAPIYRHLPEINLVGRMVVYDSHADLVERVPDQWRQFLRSDTGLPSGSMFFGASPCSSDGKIHYFTGLSAQGLEASAGERLSLPGGEYAFAEVADPSALRQTWTWLLERWLPGSGRCERKTPEFEKYTAISPTGEPVGVVEIWIPLEPSEATA